MNFLFKAAAKLVRHGLSRRRGGSDVKTPDHLVRIEPLSSERGPLDHVQVDCNKQVQAEGSSAMPRVRRYGDET